MVKKLALLLILNLLVSSLIALPVYATPAMPAPGFNIFEVNSVPSIPWVFLPAGAPSIKRTVNINAVLNSGLGSLQFSDGYSVQEFVSCTTSWNGWCSKNFISARLATINENNRGEFSRTIQPATASTSGNSGFTNLANAKSFYDTEHKKNIDMLEAVRPNFFKELDKGTVPFSSQSTINVFIMSGGQMLNRTIYDSTSDTGPCSVLRNAVTNFDTCLAVLLTSQQMQQQMNNFNVSLSVKDMSTQIKQTVLELFEKKTEVVQIPLPAVVSSLFSITQDDV